MCFDEATSSLDNETEREVQNAIEQISRAEQNCPTTLIIAHRLSTVQNCDKIIVMHKGEVAEEGSHDELLGIKDGIYKKLWDY